MLSKNYIKHIISLQRKKNRLIEREYVVEGEKMVEEAIALNPDLIQSIIGIASFLDKYRHLNLNFIEVDERELKSISTLTTPNKALAVLTFPSQEIEESEFYLALDSIQDPGNLGTIIRMADWFGLTQIICSTDCVDCFNPKVVQATMGSIFRVSVHYVDLEEFIDTKKKPVYGAVLDGSSIYDTEVDKNGVLLMGNEGNGIRSSLIEKITHPLTIPRFGQAESLNVGIATSILLSEFTRVSLK